MTGNTNKSPWAPSEELMREADKILSKQKVTDEAKTKSTKKHNYTSETMVRFEKSFDEKMGDEDYAIKLRELVEMSSDKYGDEDPSKTAEEIDEESLGRMIPSSMLCSYLMRVESRINNLGSMLTKLENVNRSKEILTTEELLVLKTFRKLITKASQL